jgi:hypothetical protein
VVSVALTRKGLFLDQRVAVIDRSYPRSRSPTHTNEGRATTKAFPVLMAKYLTHVRAMAALSSQLPRSEVIADDERLDSP